MRVRVRYFAAAKAAVGVGAETLDVPDAATVADLVAAIRPRGDLDEARAVLARCSALVDGATADAATPLRDGATVDLLPPFAGG